MQTISRLSCYFITDARKQPNQKSVRKTLSFSNSRLKVRKTRQKYIKLPSNLPNIWRNISIVGFSVGNNAVCLPSGSPVKRVVLPYLLDKYPGKIGKNHANFRKYAAIYGIEFQIESPFIRNRTCVLSFLQIYLLIFIC